MPIVLQAKGGDTISAQFIRAAEALETAPKENHRLMIMSCYIDFVAIRQLIDQLRGRVPLDEAVLMFEFMEAFRLRPPNETVAELQKLRDWCGNRNIQFWSRPVRSGTLMHAKGYAVCHLVNKKIAGGVVCVGSGNATIQGLGIDSSRGLNTELAYISSAIADVRKFSSAWARLRKDERSLKDASKQADAYNFRYTLLASGVFIHDWRKSLKSQLSIKYDLTEKAQDASRLDPELTGFGLDFGKASWTRNPFMSIKLPRSRALSRGFTRSYTIDTSSGKWCPRSVWKHVEDGFLQDSSFRKFSNGLRSLTNGARLDDIAAKESVISERLAARGFVKADSTRIERWMEKISDFLENERRLVRTFMRFEYIRLPFEFHQKREVQALYETLVDSISEKSTKSVVIGKVLAAERSGDLKALELNGAEHKKLENVVSSMR